MNLGAILLIVLVCLLLGVFPRAGSYSAGWGYFPAGGVGLLVVILIVLLVLGRI